MAVPHLSPERPPIDVTELARATALSEHSTDIVAISTIDNGVSWVSPAAERVLGISASDVIGRCPSDIVHADDLPALIESFNTVIADPSVTQPVEVRGRRSDGSYQWFECTITNRIADPVVQGLVLSLHDIDARRRSEERLRASELRVRAILETAADAIVTIDDDGIIQTFNRAAERIFGAPVMSVVGRHYRDFIPTAWATRLISDLRDGVDLASEPVETIVRRASGEEFPARISLSKVDVDGHVFYTAILRDITRQKVTERALEQMAMYDELTGLPNRRLLIDRIEDAIRRGRRHGGVVGVMFLDLDRFKLVNDSLGHDVGDSLLTLVAYRLRTVVREEDTVARLGGDEFVVLCNGLADVGALTDVAVRLADVLRSPFSVGDDEVFVTASIGISLWDGGDETALELLRYADTAMYRAKDHGRARFELFDARMQALVMARLDVESALRYALEREELCAYYQPIVALGTGRPTHLEALVRWNRPNTGLVNPNDFIHIAEDTGLIVPIGEWMLRRATTDCVGWQGEAPDVGVAVNVSGRQLNTGNFRDVVAGALADSGLPPGLLTLEITESVLLEDAQRTLLVLEELRALGVRIALDDFGTGFSSLTYLHILPIDELKIDQSFVRSLEAEVTENTLLQMIIHLGRAFGLRVVAEGVDSELKLHVLGQLGCHFGQGFLFARPEPLDTVRARFRATPQEFSTSCS
jgi:diguanylate cyclase (GGDEF)-like protein/PAS domain S-box-containing protein